jgi:HSP20 family protein
MFGASPSRVFSRDPRGRGLFDREFSPALDVIERDDDYVVIVDVPGVTNDDLDVTIADNVVTIKGEKKARSTAEAKLYRNETWVGSFQRTIGLPKGIDPSSIEAIVADGVLQLKVPKREEVKRRQIEIKVK